MTATAWPFIEIDSDGVAYIQGTATRVIEIALEQTAGQRSTREIRDAFPTISLSKIHAALGYYFDHQDECDRLIGERERRAEELLQAHGNHALQQRLQRLKVGP